MGARQTSPKSLPLRYRLFTPELQWYPTQGSTTYLTTGVWRIGKQVVAHYPFTRIKSWTNEGWYVVLETITKEQVRLMQSASFDPRLHALYGYLQWDNDGGLGYPPLQGAPFSFCPWVATATQG